MFWASLHQNSKLQKVWTGSDPDGDLPLSFLWEFGVGSGIADSSAEDPGLVQFNNPGTFTVTFTVTDALGLPDPTPATRIITVISGSSGQLIPNWTNVEYAPFCPIDPSIIVNPVLSAGDVTDVPALFVADPFLFYENAMWYMFFEVLNLDTGNGEIGLATSSDGYNWNYERIVLAEGFHHSYPFVMKYDGKYYMIPESYQMNEVRVYEATNFPYNWHFLASIVTDRDFVDPTIFRYNNKWWMFVGETSETYCYLYYSDDLTSGWIEHPTSPIESSGYGSRPGGRSVILNGDRIIRFSQNGEQVKAF